MVEEVEVIRGRSPRSVEYQSTPSMSRGDDHGTTGGTCTHTLLDMSERFELFELPWRKGEHQPTG